MRIDLLLDSRSMWPLSSMNAICGMVLNQCGRRTLSIKVKMG